MTWFYILLAVLIFGPIAYLWLESRRPRGMYEFHVLAFAIALACWAAAIGIIAGRFL